jgi:hypothetical protein
MKSFNTDEAKFYRGAIESLADAALEQQLRDEYNELSAVHDFFVKLDESANPVVYAEDVEVHRSALIKQRNMALDQCQADWAITLSHAIKFLHDIAT